MFGMQLDTIKKVEIGLCLAVLAIAGWIFWSNMRAGKDQTVSAYSDTDVLIGVDGKTASPANPPDPNKSFRNTWFINDDGRLQFKEFPLKVDSDHRAEMHFYPDQHKANYDCFPTVAQIVAAYPDAVKRFLAVELVKFLTVTKNNNARAMLTNSTFLGSRDLGIASADTAKINEECDKLIRGIRQLDDDVMMGLVEKSKYDKVLDALQAFRDCGPEDISKSPRKAAAARKVMDLGLEFMKIVQDRKVAKISEFCDDTIKVLSDAQKEQIAALGAPKGPAATGPAGAIPGQRTLRVRRPTTTPGL